MTTFRLPSSRGSQVKLGGSIRPKVLRNPRDAGPFYIRGIKAGSINEWWCYLAMLKIEKMTGWSWDYQVPLNGGRRRRGGNVADFLVKTPGPWTVLDPMGKYWHTGAREDRQQMENLCRRRGWNLIAWFTDQTPSEEMTYSFLKKEFKL